MARSSNESAYAARVVVEDLDYLRATWGTRVTDATLRRSSATLRQLLIDDELGRAWRWVGFQREPRVWAVDLKAIVCKYDTRQLAYAQAGGGNFNDAHIAGLVLVRGEHDPSGQKEPAQQRLGLRAFMESPALAVADLVHANPDDEASPLVHSPNFVSRRDVVKYVANRLGGTHISSGRTQNEQRTFELLDRAINAAQIFGKPAVLFEVLSIGQAVAMSDDANRLVKRVPADT